MTRILLAGCNGKMGRVVAELARGRGGAVIVAGFDVRYELKQEYPVFSEPSDFSGEADVLIDFSHPAYFDRLLAFARARKLPAVFATTGLSEKQMDAMREASHETPIFQSANMSLGVNLLCALAKRAAAALPAGFDVEIVEAHHRDKADAPSGTALMLRDAIASARGPMKTVCGREGRNAKREADEIGIHSLRGGTIVGEHEVLFAGPDEVISIRHSAASKKVFAEGALNAALFLCGKEPGFYTMSDYLSADGGAK